MLKFLIGVFVIFFVLPSVIFSIWSYFDDKKEAKNRKAPRPLTHAQMMALLEPDGKPAQRPSQKVERPAEKKQVEQPSPIIVKQAPHEVQTITLKREIYY